jgi:WD40 repeat protein
MLLFKKHKKRINSLAYAPDSALLASSSSDGTVRLWDLVAQMERATIDAGRAGAVDFSPDGKTLATAGMDSRLRLWAVASCQLMSETRMARSVTDVSYTPDGKKVIAVSGTALSCFKVAGNELQLAWKQSNPRGSHFYKAAISPNGALLATTESVPEKVKLWDVKSGTQKALLPLGGEPTNRIVTDVVFSPNGRWLAGVSYAVLRLWDVKGKQELAHWKQEDTYFHEVSFTPDSRYLAAVSSNATVQLWETESQRPGATFSWDIGKLKTIAFAPNGMTAAAGSETGAIVVWDMDAE